MTVLSIAQGFCCIRKFLCGLHVHSYNYYRGDTQLIPSTAQCLLGTWIHFYTGATAYSGAYFGEGSGLIHLSFVKCAGFEYDVIKCETGNVGISSTHSFDVGVKCQPGMLTLLRYFVCVCVRVCLLQQCFCFR